MQSLLALIVGWAVIIAIYYCCWLLSDPHDRPDTKAFVEALFSNNLTWDQVIAWCIILAWSLVLVSGSCSPDGKMGPYNPDADYYYDGPVGRTRGGDTW